MRDLVFGLPFYMDNSEGWNLGLPFYRQRCRMEFGVAVSPWQLFIYGIWDFSFYLAIGDKIFGTCRIANRINRGAVCGMR